MVAAIASTATSAIKSHLSFEMWPVNLWPHMSQSSASSYAIVRHLGHSFAMASNEFQDYLNPARPGQYLEVYFVSEY